MKIVVQGKSGCGDCVAAVNLLTANGLAHEYIDISTNEEKIEEMRAYWQTRNLRPSAPLIIVDGVPIGGLVDLRQFIKDIE